MPSETAPVKWVGHRQGGKLYFLEFSVWVSFVMIYGYYNNHFLCFLNKVNY